MTARKMDMLSVAGRRLVVVWSNESRMEVALQSNFSRVAVVITALDNKAHLVSEDMAHAQRIIVNQCRC